MNRIAGPLMVISAGACFGSLSLFTKLYYRSGGETFELLFIRFVSAATVLSMIAFVWWPGQGRDKLVRLAFVIGAVQIVGNYALFQGLAIAPVSLIVLLFYIYPVLVTVGASAFLEEPLTRTLVASLGLALVGIAVTLGNPSEVPITGVLLGLLAGGSTAASVLIARRAMAGTFGALQFSAISSIGPAVAISLAAGVVGLEMPPWEALGWGAAAVVIGTVLPMTLFYTGVKRIGAANTSLLTTAEPFVALFLAHLILHESLALNQLFGGALIMAGVTMVALSSHRGQPRMGAVP